MDLYSKEASMSQKLREHPWAWILRVLDQGNHQMSVRLDEGDLVDLRKLYWQARCNTQTRTSEAGTDSLWGGLLELNEVLACAERNKQA